MTSDDIIRMAREAGYLHFEQYPEAERALITKLIGIAADSERTARRAAQIENEELKACLARSGVEHRKEMAKAVRAMRDACAKVCDGVYHQHIGPQYGEVRHGIAACAAAIRALGNTPDLRPNTDVATDSPSVAEPDQQIETQFSSGTLTMPGGQAYPATFLSVEPVKPPEKPSGIGDIHITIPPRKP